MKNQLLIHQSQSLSEPWFEASHWWIGYRLVILILNQLVITFPYWNAIRCVQVCPIFNTQIWATCFSNQWATCDASMQMKRELGALTQQLNTTEHQLGVGQNISRHVKTDHSIPNIHCIFHSCSKWWTSLNIPFSPLFITLTFNQTWLESPTHAASPRRWQDSLVPASRWCSNPLLGVVIAKRTRDVDTYVLFRCFYDYVIGLYILLYKYKKNIYIYYVCVCMLHLYY